MQKQHRDGAWSRLPGLSEAEGLTRPVLRVRLAVTAGCLLARTRGRGWDTSPHREAAAFAQGELGVEAADRLVTGG